MGIQFDNIEEFQRHFEDFAKNIDEFAEECDREIAGRLLAYVIPDTPVGKNRGPGGAIKGGTLRRGWTAQTHSQAFGDAQSGKSTSNANEQKAKVDAAPVKKSGRDYTIDIINPVEYAMYVEYGHRTRGGNGFVSGQYMLTNSIKRLEPKVPGILDRKLRERFDKVGDGQ